MLPCYIKSRQVLQLTKKIASKFYLLLAKETSAMPLLYIIEGSTGSYCLLQRWCLPLTTSIPNPSRRLRDAKLIPNVHAALENNRIKFVRYVEAKLQN